MAALLVKRDGGSTVAAVVNDKYATTVLPRHQVHRPVPGYEASMKAAVSRVFSGLAPDRALWRANWALQNNAEIISTDLPWHPTNIKLGGKVSMEGPHATHAPPPPTHADHMVMLIMLIMAINRTVPQ